jgi:CHAT domain-containing protein
MLQRTIVSVRCAEAKVLLAAESSPLEPGMSTLSFAMEEIMEVKKVLPPGAVMTLPSYRSSSLDVMGGTTVQGLLDGLPDANILHLACHGSQNAKNPLESAFLLRDGSLTIAQIMPVPLPRAFLAFLSACETARGDVNYTEQVIHLGAAMLFAGFKSVVGTMW